MHVEKIKAKGSLHAVLRDEFGNVKEDRYFDNLVVNAGLAFIASRMTAATAGVMSHMAVGTGGTAAAAGETILVTELDRNALTSTTLVTTTATNDSVEYVASFAAGEATGALVEAGLFNDPTAGTMLCRTVFAVINKGALDSLTITWKVVIA